MITTIIIIIAIFIAILLVSFLWRVFKTTIKIFLIGAIALGIIFLVLGYIPFGDDFKINESDNSSNFTNEVTAQVTGFVSSSFDKATLSLKREIGEKLVDDASEKLDELKEGE